MKFCSKCDNMYYIGISETDGNKLTNYCRNCGHVDESTDGDNICVLKTHVKMGEQKYNHIINKYTKLDPTLPHVYNINCPDKGCVTNTDVENNKRDVLYIRYDEKNLKYLYMCTTCDTVWKTDDNK